MKLQWLQVLFVTLLQHALISYAAYLVCKSGLNTMFIIATCRNLWTAIWTRETWLLQAGKTGGVLE